MLKIRIKNHQVNKQFKLSNIRINVLPKEIFALIGKSGSGKSTLAKIIVGLLPDEFCSIVVNGVELNNQLERLIPQFFKAGYLPQNLHLKPFHTVIEFLNFIFQNSNSPEKEINKYVKIFHLEKIVHTQVTNLSGGEKQKLGILNAISEPIEYLVLDEPFSQLDTEQKQEFASIIKEIIEIKNIPCLLISHDLSDVLKLSHSIGVINHGKIILNGDIRKILTSRNKMVINLKNALFNWHDSTSFIIENLKKL
jgi:ABC-type multidrug transport system ATPase subunit